jgi:HSP20 family protein
MNEDNKENNLASIIEESEGQLTIDVYQTPDDIYVESTIAGVEPENLDIDITNESVTIKGERRKEEIIADEDYLHQECYWGKFSRSVILPQEIDPDKAHAEFKNGILRIKLPKLNRGRVKKLKIKAEE